MRNSEKIWYIFVEEKQEGPFSAKELLFDDRVTLDTFVWKEGYPEWVLLQRVEELRRLFTKEQNQEKADEETEAKTERVVPQEEIVLDYGKEPNLFYLWLLVAMILLFYFAYKLL